MTSKKNKNKNKSNRNSKKRDKPETTSWDETALMDLLAQDVRQLLLVRGEKQMVKCKKADMIDCLKDKYEVELKRDFDKLTVKQLMVELRLRKLDDSFAKKDLLIQRLRGKCESAPAPPEKKKGKRGSGTVKSATQKIYVAIYIPPECKQEEDTDTSLLGVFKQKNKAYEKASNRLMEDLKEKYKDNKKKLETATTKIGRVKDGHFEKKLETVNECVTKAYDNEDEAPYVEVTETSLLS